MVRLYWLDLLMSWTMRALSGRVEGLEGDRHVQRCQVGVHAANLLLQVGALGVVLVEAGTLQILAGKGDRLEVAAAASVLA